MLFLIFIETTFSEIPEILSRFVPDDNIIFFEPNSESPERMIFGIKWEFLPFEEECLKELDQELKETLVSK